MKFYRDKTFYYWFKIKDNNLTAIHINQYKSVRFLKNGNYHNFKNASCIRYDGFKSFYLNGEFYGNSNKFNKKTWRKFVKMQIFL